MLKRASSSFMLALMLAVAVTSAFSVNGLAWSNGGYTIDLAHPEYGTHDWIAEHALDWVPDKEKEYISSNLEYYLYGTELPDNGNAPDGIGDSRLHHVYFNSERNVIDDAAALRASDEFYDTLDKLASKDYKNAAEHVGAMTHYIADMTVFAHVMGSGTLWGPETHHSDYEDHVDRQTSSYNSTFNSFLVFDDLNQMNPFDATMSLAHITCFDNVTYTALWMDQNYNWSNPKFVKQVGESLNLAVNYVADVLHALYLKSEAQNQQFPQPSASPPSDSYPSQPTFPPVVIPLWVIGAAIAVTALMVTVALARSRPRHPRRRLVRLFWNVVYISFPQRPSHHQNILTIEVTRSSARSEGETNKMPYCPECGGDMRYSIATKRYACQSCGLTVSHQELIEMRDQMRPSAETEEEQKQKQRKEYLKWWLSSKKK